ncbi:MAG: YHS domain-containing (seleno)protein [Leptolyngbyaceae cyanobacterium]
MQLIVTTALFIGTLLSVGCSFKSATSGVSETATESIAAESATPTTAEVVTSEAKAEVPAEPEPTLAAVFVADDAAIAGADPVAYFTESAYVPGQPEFAYEWSGATWHFASAENRDAFANDPTAYAPAYGGFCAWAVSQGYTAPIDPEAWKIVDNKLYLNYDQRIQARWAQDIPKHIAQADSNWPAVLEN